MFWKGSTAREGLSGSASGWLDPNRNIFRKCRSWEVFKPHTPGSHRLGDILWRLRTPYRRTRSRPCRGFVGARHRKCKPLRIPRSPLTLRGVSSLCADSQAMPTPNRAIRGRRFHKTTAPPFQSGAAEPPPCAAAEHGGRVIAGAAYSMSRAASRAARATSRMTSPEKFARSRH